MSVPFLQPPSQEILNRVANRLEELQVYVPKDDAAAVVAATLEWVTQSQAGKEFFVKLFGFDWEAGQSDRVYYLMDTGDRVTGDDIYFLKAAVCKGRFIPPALVDSQHAEKNGCTECGILSHCGRQVVDGQGRTQTVCNHCLSHSESTSLRSKSGGTAECRGCTVSLCEHNPQKRLHA